MLVLKTVSRYVSVETVVGVMYRKEHTRAYAESSVSHGDKQSPVHFSSRRCVCSSAFSMTGLGKGGAQIQDCKKAFKKAVELLVDLASLQTSFLTLDEVIKATNRRVNAIEYVIIPKVQVWSYTQWQL